MYSFGGNLNKKYLKITACIICKKINDQIYHTHSLDGGIKQFSLELLTGPGSRKMPRVQCIFNMATCMLVT